MSANKAVTKTLRFVVSAALLIYLAWRTDWHQVGQVFVHLRLELWLSAVGLFLLAQAISAVRWRLLAQPLGFQAPLRDFFCFYFVGMFFNLLLPTSVGGDVVRAWYLDGRSGRRLAAFLSVFVDRFSGLLVLLALACVADILCPIALPLWIEASIWATAGCAVMGLLSVPALARHLAVWSLEQGAPITLARSWCGGVMARCKRATTQALRVLAIFRGRTPLLLSTTALSLLVQALNILLVWLIGQAIGVTVPASYYGIVVPMVTLLTLLPVSLNGMGVREGGMVLFLAPLGVPSATALSLAFLWFSVFVAASVFGAGVYLFSNHSRPLTLPSPPTADGGEGRVRGEQLHDPFVGRDSNQGRARQSQAAA
jgi:uncharacterized protein (TIRG00374 family)